MIHEITYITYKKLNPYKTVLNTIWYNCFLSTSYVDLVEYSLAMLVGKTRSTGSSLVGCKMQIKRSIGSDSDRFPVGHPGGAWGCVLIRPQLREQDPFRGGVAQL